MGVALDDQSLQVQPCLLQFGRTGGRARLQFGDALLVGYFPGGGAFQVYRGLVGSGVGVLRGRVQLIAARHSGGVFSIERVHLPSALLDLCCQLSDLYRQRRLLAIHLRNAAGQDHA